MEVKQPGKRIIGIKSGLSLLISIKQTLRIEQKYKTLIKKDILLQHFNNLNKIIESESWL